MAVRTDSDMTMIFGDWIRGVALEAEPRKWRSGSDSSHNTRASQSPDESVSIIENSRDTNQPRP